MNPCLLLTTLLGLAPAGEAAATAPALPTNLTNEAIYAYMKANDYPSWPLLPGTIADHFDAPTSHDTYLTVRVNDIAYQYLSANYPFSFQPYKDSSGSNFLNLPPGSLIYKVAADKRDGPPSAGLAVLYKAPEEQLKTCAWPQCQNGWAFASFDTPPESGNTGNYDGDPTCAACHTGAYSKDASENTVYNQSAKYMLSEADYVWSVFYQMARKLD